MILSLGFVSFVLFNFLLLAAVLEGSYVFAGIFLLLSAVDLIGLSLTCKKLNT